MTPSRRVLLQLGLLLAAAASWPAAAGQCEPGTLAPGVALCCTFRLPTAICCRALVHSVTVGGGTGCLCRLAAERVVINTALNATDLLRLYATCAPPSSGGVAPSSCDDDGGASRAAAEPPSSAFDPCAPAALADQMGLFCGLPGGPNAPCCLAVVAAVQLGGGDEPCFCRTARLASAVGGARGLIDLYAACGGLSTDRASHLASTCPLMS
ncbi:hypothetical protein EJB05_50185, partial [Eragrostis curvula]